LGGGPAIVLRRRYLLLAGNLPQRRGSANAHRPAPHTWHWPDRPVRGGRAFCTHPGHGCAPVVWQHLCDVGRWRHPPPWTKL